MIRRDFFSAALATVAGLFGVRSLKPNPARKPITYIPPRLLSWVVLVNGQLYLCRYSYGVFINGKDCECCAPGSIGAFCLGEDGEREYVRLCSPKEAADDLAERQAPFVGGIRATWVGEQAILS